MRSPVGRLARAASWCIVVMGLLTAPGVEGQPRTKVARVGYLGNTAGPPPHPLTEGLSALGWVEGQNVAIEWRFTEGQVDRAPRLAAELVDLGLDVIVAVAPPNVQALQRATSSIPIVMLAVADPVRLGFIGSLARPGGNITGVSSAIAEGFMGKSLELVKEALPAATRVGLLVNAANPLNYAAARSQELMAAAQALKVQLQHLDVRSAGDIDRVMDAATLNGLHAVLVVGDPLTFAHRDRIHALALQHRVPTFVPAPEYVSGKALLAYGPSLADAGRHAAGYVDKILKGRKPADLPVEQPREYRLVVNLRTARILGLTIPPSLLLRADQLIE
jgi:putative ABC transport system substrate-binding protein